MQRENDWSAFLVLEFEVRQGNKTFATLRHGGNKSRYKKSYAWQAVFNSKAYHHHDTLDGNR